MLKPRNSTGMKIAIIVNGMVIREGLTKKEVELKLLLSDIKTAKNKLFNLICCSEQAPKKEYRDFYVIEVNKQRELLNSLLEDKII